MKRSISNKERKVKLAEACKRDILWLERELRKNKKKKTAESCYLSCHPLPPKL